MITDVFSEWLESIAQQGTSYISDLVKVFENAESVGKELETEMVVWEKEKSKWLAIEIDERYTEIRGDEFPH